MISEEQEQRPAIDDVDPDIRQFHRRTSADYLRLSEGRYRDFAHRRDVAEQVRKPWVQGGPVMHRTEELMAGELPVRIRIHHPDASTDKPALIYVHGGGWTVFSIDTHDRLMREYAARSGCAVVGVDYSLSPEFPYPRALHEIAGLVGWLREHGTDHGIDPARLAIGGDSAGGNLALATALMLRDRGDGAALRAMLFNYGVFDGDARPSYQRYDGDDYMLTANEMAFFWRNYLGDGDLPQDPYARPVLADTTGLPPAYFCIAECDILADENLAMAERLHKDGVPAEEHLYPGATHSFLEAVEHSPLAARALDDASAWLRARLSS
jgi:acetyl esterase